MEDLYAKLEEHGITKARLKKALDSKDNWGALVHSFEYLTVLGAVETMWPERMVKSEDGEWVGIPGS